MGGGEGRLLLGDEGDRQGSRKRELVAPREYWCCGRPHVAPLSTAASTLRVKITGSPLGTAAISDMDA